MKISVFQIIFFILIRIQHMFELKEAITVLQGYIPTVREQVSTHRREVGLEQDVHTVDL